MSLAWRNRSVSFGRPDLDALAGLLRDAARSLVLPHFRRLSPGAVRCKTGPLDVVTDADVAAERAITDGLKRLFPGCMVIGEEAASADPRRLDGLAEAALAFTVDPIDGTSNFAAGLPLFGTMAAAIERGRHCAGAAGPWCLDRIPRRQPDRVACRSGRRSGTDDRDRFVSIPAGAAARQGLRPAAAPRRLLGLSLRGA